MTSETRTLAGQVVGSYSDGHGQQHVVVVRRPETSRYLVGEISEQGGWQLIEELAGEQESEATALAVARDYLEQHAQGVRR